MTTKKLYTILDKAKPPEVCYNLRKTRNAPYWRVRVWVTKTFDNLGIHAPYIQDEIYPEYYELADTIADFKNICDIAIKTCS